ncbi:MAG: MBL fold metallo-hydrolase [Oscillospiraceae bacterium]|nr:MBL fold metallo-hydrolase [Oscillospiraceae bacterium]
MREGYAQYLADAEALAQKRYGKYFIRQGRRYVAPFRIYGNVWYVGDNWVCVHLIDTGDGLLLLDAGNCGAEASLLSAIAEAGFRPSDVRWIVLSHGHMDHFGASEFFRDAFGTQVLLGAPDAQMLREQPERTLIHHTGSAAVTLPTVDRELADGETVRFGGTEVMFRLVPGHMDGCVAAFFDAHGELGVKRCGWYGGFGFNTLEKNYLLELGDTSFSRRAIYLESLAKVRDEHVDIFLGNHPHNNDTLGRMRRMLEHPDAPNPFLDPDAWGAYLDKKREKLLEFMADPKNN